MTLIEFFDEKHVNNVVSGLALRPEKIIFIGASRKQMEKAIKRYAQIFTTKGINCEFSIRVAPKSNLLIISETLRSVIQENPGCIIDLTGGDDLALIAVGTVTHELHDQGIKLIRVNLSTGRMIECFGNESDIEFSKPQLTVEENINLYGGGIVLDGQIKNEATFLFEWNHEFKIDVDTIWNIATRNILTWNWQINQLSEFVFPRSTNVLCDFSENGEKGWKRNFSIFQFLLEERIIFDFLYNESSYEFRTKNIQISHIFSSAGKILELKTALTAMDIKDGEEAFFNDILVGVQIDWDGEIHPFDNDIYDTENEIDVICMRGLQPLFISCKNGAINEDELYKLNTVANRFGGEQVKKALVATYVDKNEQSLSHFRQRAKDMDIHLIENVDKMSDDEFRKRIKAIF